MLPGVRTMRMTKSVAGCLLVLVACSSRDASRQAPAGSGGEGSDGSGRPAPATHSFDAAPDAIRAEATSMVNVQAGPVFGRESTCGRRGPHPAVQHVRQEVAAFRIHVAPATCEQWASCVAAGGCQESPPREFCKYGRAVVSARDAAAYCAWQHAELPSWGQWHRAIRGDRRDDFPTGATWNASLACKRPTNPGSMMKRCEYVSEHGVEYAMENPNEAEWTRDVDCLNDEQRRVAVDLIGNNLGLPSLGQKRAEFRCVASAQPAP